MASNLLVQKIYELKYVIYWKIGDLSTNFFFYALRVISYLVKESPTMFSKFKITDQGQNLLNFKCLTTTLSA